jgi:signal transduction histidine kinase
MAWPRRLTPAWVVTALVGVTVFALLFRGLLETPGGADIAAYAYLATMVFQATSGFVVWAVRPSFNPLGPLWAISPIVRVVESLTLVYPTSKAAATFGYLVLGVGLVIGGHWIISYPTGRPYSRWAKAWVVTAYTFTVALNLPYLLFLPTYLYVGPAPFDLVAYNRLTLVAWVVPISAALFLLYLERLRTLSPGARRTVAPLIVGAIIYAPVWTYLIVRETWDGTVYSAELLWLNTAAVFVFSVLALSGLFFTRRARGVVGDLVLDLGRLGPGDVQQALARALGDPTLRVGYWLAERGVWADENGAAFELPSDTNRSVTYVGDHLAVMVHDSDLLDQPALLEAIRSTAAYALENERLRAELVAQLVELRESRARIVRTADEERRRLERDLHDGAQQRLLGLGMALQLLHGHVDEDGDSLLAESEVELQQALHELRELARGIHPAILTDSGLGEAVRTLAQRSPVPVEVDAGDERLPAPIETAAYYVVAEALANVVKYAQASKATVYVGRDNGVVRIDIRDDGVGGADARGGTGLRGLADRVGALNGRLRVDSPAGAGTRVAAEIPCEP